MLPAGASVTLTSSVRTAMGLVHRRDLRVTRYVEARAKVHVSLKTASRASRDRVTVTTTRL
jgi:hypothetical protein